MGELDDWTLQSINEGLFGDLLGFGSTGQGPEPVLDESFIHIPSSLEMGE
jgi:hypothetical protein